MTLYEEANGFGGSFQLFSVCRKFLTPEDEASIFTVDRFPLWYRRAAEQPAGSFVFSLRPAEGPGSLPGSAAGA